MRFPRIIASMLLAASGLMAQSWTDLHRDYANADRLHYDIARDRANLNRDIATGRDCAAADQARDLARDQRRLHAQVRDIQHDRRNLRYAGWRDRY